METKIKKSSDFLLEKALNSLQETEILARDRLIWGVDLVYRHLENVDRDWLEQWGEQESPASIATEREKGRIS